MRIELNNIFKSYDGKVVLQGINICLDEIHSLGIIGPSGGGKSTLLRLIAGIEAVDSGTITVNNTALKNSEKYLNEYRKTIGVVFQAYNLFPHISAEKNVTLPLIKIHHKGKEEAREITKAFFNRFSLNQHMNKKPGQLSGGQQQRVAIIRALSTNPQLMLLDEPTSALDPVLTGEVLNAIYEVQNENKDLIIVTHHMEFAKKACDYILFVENGKIIEHGSSKDFFNNPKSESLNQFLKLI